jgi:hypothetical protein
MNNAQISLSCTFLVLFCMYASKFFNYKETLQSETTFEIIEPVQESFSVDSFPSFQLPKREPLSYFFILDTLFGLPLAEVPLPSGWDIVKNKWVGPGNTFVKEMLSNESTQFNVDMEDVIRGEVLPVLNALDKRITHLQLYPEIAKAIMDIPELDIILKINSNQWQLESKGIEFEDNNGRKGMVLIQLWSNEWNGNKYCFPGIIWMEGDKEVFSNNKDILLYAVQNVRYNTENHELITKLQGLKESISRNDIYQFDDFVIDKETGAQMRWSEHAEKYNNREKEILSETLLEKGVCPDRIQSFWNSNLYSTYLEEGYDSFYGHQDFKDDLTQLYDPNVNEYPADWEPLQLDTLDNAF